MQIELAYGKTGLKVELPREARPMVIRKPPFDIPADPDELISNILNMPIEVPRLEVLGREASSACILICDITRPVPNHLFLRPIIERLVHAGIKLEAITVLVATGLHRRTSA